MTRKRCEHFFQQHYRRNPCQRDNQVPRGGEGGGMVGVSEVQCEIDNQSEQWSGGVNENDPPAGGGGAM